MPTMSRVDISVLLILTLVSTNGLVCNSQLDNMELWRSGMVVGVGTLDNLFQFTDQPVIFSPNKEYYLSVQAEPANNPLNPGDEFFCWLAVVNQSIASNKANVWRAPCDKELQRSNDSMQLCYFGISADGNLLLTHTFSGGPIAFSSNTTGLGVDHAIVDNSGSVLLQTNSSATVWTSADHPSPASCLGQLESFNHTLRTPTAHPPPHNTTNLTASGPPASRNSGHSSGSRASIELAIVCALLFVFQFLR